MIKFLIIDVRGLCKKPMGMGMASVYPPAQYSTGANPEPFSSTAMPTKNFFIQSGQK
jgi:hypothetical protein